VPRVRAEGHRFLGGVPRVRGRGHPRQGAGVERRFGCGSTRGRGADARNEVRRARGRTYLRGRCGGGRRPPRAGRPFRRSSDSGENATARGCPRKAAGREAVPISGEVAAPGGGRGAEERRHRVGPRARRAGGFGRWPPRRGGGR
jgi:hypothetical protein